MNNTNRILIFIAGLLLILVRAKTDISDKNSETLRKQFEALAFRIEKEND